MIERIRELIERFPVDEGLVCVLMQSDSAFDALCQEYKQSTDELRRWEVMGGFTAGSEANRLKERLCWLEHEILAKIEGHRPV